MQIRPTPPLQKDNTPIINSIYKPLCGQKELNGKGEFLPRDAVRKLGLLSAGVHLSVTRVSLLLILAAFLLSSAPITGRPWVHYK